MSDHDTTATPGHQGDDINAPVLALVSLITIVITLVLIFFIQAVYYYLDDLQQQQKLAGFDVKYAEAETAIEQQRSKLGAPPAWVNQDAGTVSVPIEKAMEMVVAEFSQPNNADSQ